MLVLPCFKKYTCLKETKTALLKNGWKKLTVLGITLGLKKLQFHTKIFASKSLTLNQETEESYIFLLEIIL